MDTVLLAARALTAAAELQDAVLLYLGIGCGDFLSERTKYEFLGRGW